jgi:DNA-binding SARP family transcriptional activator
MAATSPRTRRTRTAGEVIRGLGSLLLIVLLLAGIPAGLLILAGPPPLPPAVPTLADIAEAITRPDDGTLLVAALIWVGWLGWASFAISLAVEIPAALRGVQAPRLPTLGPQQRLAAGLVAAVTLLFTGGTNSLAADASATAGTSSAPVAAAPPGAAAEADDERAGVHVVDAGDTLWHIAKENLGSGHRYPDLYAASKNTVQPDGRRLTNPDLIRVGWEITIPSAGDSIADADLVETEQPDAKASDGGDRVGNKPDARRTEPTAPTESVPRSTPGPAPNSTLDEQVPARAPLADMPRPAVVAEEANDDDDGSMDVCTAGGIGVALAGGLLLYVGTLRARQHRHRRPGQRIALPCGDAARTEDELRRISDVLTLDQINRALRTLAARCAVTGAPLPSLRFARLIGGQLELHLAEPAEPPAPFLPTTSPSLWVLDSDGDILDGDQADEYPAPYPTLLTIGHDADGGLILVDLEHVGVLAIDGDNTATVEVLTAVATELATSPWSDDVHVTAVGVAKDLGELLEGGRISHVDGSEAEIDRMLDQLATRVAADRVALATDGVATASAARPTSVAEGTWAPEVVLIGAPLTGVQRNRLADLVLTEPQVAVAAVTTHEPPLTEWATLLHPDNPEHAVIDPLGLGIRPQRISPKERDGLVDLLASGHAEPTPAAAPWHVDIVTTPPVGALHADSSDDGTAPQNAHESNGAPMVAVLGPVEIQHAPELTEPNKRGQLTALAAFLALNPGQTRDAVDEAMWPGRRVSLATRNTAMTKLRNWLGTDPDANDYVPRAAADGYRLHPSVRTDWHQFCELLPEGPAKASTTNLRAALNLVRDQPFKGANPRRYIWTERIQQEMIAAIGDVADELARRALHAGDTRLALTAVAAGLAAEPVSETLWRHRLRALHAAGDRSALEQAADQLTALADDLGGELDDETIELLHQLLSPARPVATSRRTA